MKPYVKKLLNGATTTGAGSSDFVDAQQKTFVVSGITSSGAGAAVVKVQGSNDDDVWVDLDVGMSITLATTTASGTSDSYVSNDRYAFLRGYVVSISGTEAAVTLTVAY